MTNISKITDIGAGFVESLSIISHETCGHESLNVLSLPENLFNPIVTGGPGHGLDKINLLLHLPPAYYGRLRLQLVLIQINSLTCDSATIMPSEDYGYISTLYIQVKA
jgi:hypothetical protein